MSAKASPAYFSTVLPPHLPKNLTCHSLSPRRAWNCDPARLGVCSVTSTSETSPASVYRADPYNISRQTLASPAWFTCPPREPTRISRAHDGQLTSEPTVPTHLDVSLWQRRTSARRCSPTLTAHCPRLSARTSAPAASTSTLPQRPPKAELVQTRSAPDQSNGQAPHRQRAPRV